MWRDSDYERPKIYRTQNRKRMWSLSFQKEEILGTSNDMSTKSINQKVFDFLRQLSDKQEIQIVQNNHIKVTGLYGGEKRTIFLSSSPSQSHYPSSTRSQLRRFLRSIRSGKSIPKLF